MIENLENKKKLVLKKIVKNEKIRWIISQFGGTICVHKGYYYSYREKKKIPSFFK